MVIKPANQGCSYGVFYVASQREFNEAITIASKFAPKLIAEQYIEGREFTVGIFYDPDTSVPRILPVIETILKGKKIVDFSVKYPGGEDFYEEILPANLSHDDEARMTDAAKTVFERLGCRGYSRMDLRMDEKGDLYFLENNTAPGMLSEEESDFPKMLWAAEISLETFVDKMIRQALIRDDKLSDAKIYQRIMADSYGVRLLD